MTADPRWCGFDERTAAHVWDMNTLGYRLVLHAPGTGEWSDQASEVVKGNRWHAEFRDENDSGFGGEGDSAAEAIAAAAERVRTAWRQAHYAGRGST